MFCFFAISDSGPVTRALENVIRVLYGSGVASTNIVLGHTIAPTFRDRAERIQAFDDLAERLDICLKDSGEQGAQVVCCVSVSIEKFEEFDPIKMKDAPSVIGMLILAFPEVHWVIGDELNFPVVTAVAIGGGSGGFVSPSLDETVEFARGGYCPYFDGVGIRDRIYQTCRTPAKLASYLPVRKELAVAIDEETSYAYFNAYTAYRFGYRAIAVTSKRVFAHLLTAGDCPSISVDIEPMVDEMAEPRPVQRFFPWRCEPPKVLIEDIGLNFPDRDSVDSLSDLKARDQNYGRLTCAAHRIIMTGGDGKMTGSEGGVRTRVGVVDYLMNIGGYVMIDSEEYDPSDTTAKTAALIHKPFAGIFDLKSKAGLNPPESYDWPPEAPEIMAQGGHSCPGALLAIAQRLMKRAERLEGGVTDAEGAVRGAVLSTMAVELLGSMTPTASLEALALKHRFEALAEFQFYGVEAELDVDARLEDLEREIKSISNSLGDRDQTVVEWTWQAGIVDGLTALYRNHNQFDEEQICLNRARSLHRRVRFSKARGSKDKIRSLYNCIGNLSLMYLNWLLASLSHLAAAALGSIIILWCLFSPFLGSEHALLSAVLSFVGETPMWIDASDTIVGSCQHHIMWMGMASGMFHLGVFISHIYSIISRR